MIGNEGAQVLAAALARKTDQQVDATRDRILTNLIKEELQTMIIDEVRFAACRASMYRPPAEPPAASPSRQRCPSSIPSCAWQPSTACDGGGKTLNRAGC